MARKWCEVAPFFLRAIFLLLRHRGVHPPFLVHASGAVALKVAQVPSTAVMSTLTSAPQSTEMMEPCSQ